MDYGMGIPLPGVIVTSRKETLSCISNPARGAVNHWRNLMSPFTALVDDELIMMFIEGKILL